MADVKVAKVSEIPDGKGRAFDVEGVRIAVFNVGGTFRAIGDSCTHLGASLAEGAVAGQNVICPWHGAQFNLHTGDPLGPPARGGTGCFTCRVDGEDVVVEV